MVWLQSSGSKKSLLETSGQDLPPSQGKVSFFAKIKYFWRFCQQTLMPGDWVIMLTTLLGILYLTWLLSSSKGNVIGIRVHALSPSKTYLFSPAQSGDYSIKGSLGISVITIKEGKVRFKSSPCQNKICLHAGWLSQSGDIAACLPNGIVVELLGEDEPYDSISF